MEFRSVLRDLEASGDFFVTCAFGKHGEHFRFARGERFVQPRFGFIVVGSGGKQQVHLFGSERREPGRDRFDCGEDFMLCSFMAEHSANARVQQSPEISTADFVGDEY